MATRKPLVLVAGRPEELAAGDRLYKVRELLTAARTYYVRTDGNDSNDGLANSSGGAFLTIQKAIDTVASLDMGIQQVTIQVAAGTYAPIALKSYVGSVFPRIIGDTATPSNVTISATAGSTNALIATDAGSWEIAGIKFQASGTSGSGIRVEGRSHIQISGYCEFGTCAGRHIFAYKGSVIIAANIRISGGATAFAEAGYPGGIISYTSGYTCTLVGTPAFSNAFALGSMLAVVVINGITFSGAATGPRYLAVTNGIIQTFGTGATYLPGNSAGTTATGGLYQ